MNLTEATEVTEYGGKAVNLGRLLRAGVPVPPGVAVGLSAFAEDVAVRHEVAGALVAELDPNKTYAVRSSATAEDADDASWAGQFESFLFVKPADVLATVARCHGSTKNRASAYASEQNHEAAAQIAVVVQEMLDPDYAGVLFTTDPVTGAAQFVTEYITGVGEGLVSGTADPDKLSWQPGAVPEAPFPIAELDKLAHSILAEYDNVPQDIEWVALSDKIYIVQTRPVTTVAIASTRTVGLGEPADLFYWGPSRASHLYMSDFMGEVRDWFEALAADNDLPTPPETLILFHNKQMVWLADATAFAQFTQDLFVAYKKATRIDADIAAFADVFEKEQPTTDGIKTGWRATLFAEFALYGARATVGTWLDRFDETKRQEIWGRYTTPITQTFIARIDDELLAAGDPVALAEKYPWITHGYSGINDDAEQYFTDRLATLREHQTDAAAPASDEKTFDLSEAEVAELTLVRSMATFMDNRKAWMMQTRRQITAPLCDIEHGWHFKEGVSRNLTAEQSASFWDRYVNFRASGAALSGTVACNGGRHFLGGEVAIVTGVTDQPPAGKILVVPSTSPSFVPHMRVASAFVTDHGGMMSHAAIVAREFNLPCIVGTKQATKALQTGDHIVLNLTTGEILQNQETKN